MKRTGNLIDKIYALDNLQLAYYKARKGKEEQKDVKDYASNLNENLKQLQKQIKSGQVIVGNYHYFTIYDPKERVICAASFPERVLHHAIMNICHEYFEKYLIYDTYATRINKGTYKALDKTRKNMKKYDWYFKFDIRKYFDTIDHGALFELLSTKFKDKKLLHIFEQIINSYKVKDNKGLPIGNLTSQYFANMYLGKLDHYIKHGLKIKGYVRYMDDFTIWGMDKSELKMKGSKIKKFLETELKLSLKIQLLNKSANGLSFLSYRLYPNKVLLSRRAKKRFKRKSKDYIILFEKEEWTQEVFADHFRPLLGFVNYAYSKKIRNEVLGKYGH